MKRFGDSIWVKSTQVLANKLSSMGSHHGQPTSSLEFHKNSVGANVIFLH